MWTGRGSRPLPHSFPRHSRRLPETDDARHIQRARAPSSLLCAAVNQREKPHIFSNIENPHALRTVQFVPAGGQQVDVHLLHMKGNVTVRLHRIRVKKDSPLTCHLPDLRNRLDGSDLIVRRHHGNQYGIRT